MTKNQTRLQLLALAGALALGAFAVGGCTDSKGPAEKAGEKVDDAVEKVKDAIDPKGPAEKLGEKIDDALDNDND